MPPTLIPPELVALIARGISVNVASRDARGRPTVDRGVGSDIGPDGRRITVYIARAHGAQVALDVATNGHIAVVFSEPATHRTLQVKATRAQVRPANEADRPALERYMRSMEHEIGRVGHPPAVVRAMLAHRLEDVVAITFEPEQAFDQTPGPKAGTKLGEAGA